MIDEIIVSGKITQIDEDEDIAKNKFLEEMAERGIIKFLCNNGFCIDDLTIEDGPDYKHVYEIEAIFLKK
jgi:hypothetical protein